MANSGPRHLFIGGAERARRNARKQSNRPHSPRSNKRHRHEKTLPPYPKSMRPYDRFFGSLLSSSCFAFKESQIDDTKHEELMTRCCSLLNVPSLPAVPVKSSFVKSMEMKADARSHHLMQRASSFLSEASTSTNYSTGSSSGSSGSFDNAKSYYLSKAPLILEESRCIIADALNRLSDQKSSGGCVLSLKLLSVEEKYPKLQQAQYAPLLMNFSIEKVRENEKGMSWSRPGNVFVLCPRNNIESSILGCVAPMPKNKCGSDEGSRSQSSKTCISLMVFRRGDLNTTDVTKGIEGSARDLFQATALTTLISQVRQMEACLRMIKVPFMSKLLGCKKSTHIRFNDSDEEEIVEDNCLLDEEVYDDGGDYSDNEYDASWNELMAKLPQLNVTQEKAATCFLNSLPSSLILVQGPPGTGKSTFLVNVICRRLATDPNARLLVTAPTNKAVTVLAQRFLDVINAVDKSVYNNTNPILVGVEDKLVNDEEQPDVMTTSLRSIFVYTWLESVKMEWATFMDDLEKFLSQNDDVAFETLINRARKMQHRLTRGISNTFSRCNYDANAVVRQLEAAWAAKSWEATVNDCPEIDDSPFNTFSHLLNDSICHGSSLLAHLNEVDSSDVISELTSTARVIFCTLSTAGSSVLKQTRQIDDLLVDEAAAATEAEICIPFHLHPKRMLAVGDPMQLPPTIISRRAADLGLSKSMHDRLMNDCSEEYFMLDQQYRMVPSISSFPCKQFYDGNITDGENVTNETYFRDTYLSMARPYTFIHVHGNEFKGRCGSYANNEECTKIIQIVEELRAKSNRTLSDWDSHDRLRIITFYQAQTLLLKKLLAKRKLHKVLVATVDSSQGCEADTVIISFTRSNNKKGVFQAAGFLADDRRINVALTRGRHQLICVGNTDTLGCEGSEALKQLVLDAKQRRCITN